MRLLGSLQDRFGFTRSEIVAVLFLVSTFLGGLGIRWAGRGAPDVPGYNYAASDSIFAARSRNPAVPRETRSQQQAPQKLPPGAARININTAGTAELMRLPGIGPGLAGRIVSRRTEHGPFQTVDDLAAVQGIGPKKLERLRPFLFVHTR